MVKVLILYGFEVNVKMDSGYFLLYMVIYNGYLDVVKVLVFYGVSLE